METLVDNLISIRLHDTNDSLYFGNPNSVYTDIPIFVVLNKSERKLRKDYPEFDFNGNYIGLKV